MNLPTADLYDAYESKLRSCTEQFRQYGGVKRFQGPVRTVKVYEDNALIKKLLGQPGNGAVLVVDGAASLRCALLGDLMAALGQKSGWVGVVIYGAVRDVTTLATLEFGVKALGSNPVKSSKHGAGQIDVPVTFGGVTFRPGEWLYSDEDGILLSAEKLEPMAN
jgi:regulator of ribonuclease activity A